MIELSLGVDIRHDAMDPRIRMADFIAEYPEVRQTTAEFDHVNLSIKGQHTRRPFIVKN